ncbi:MAG: type II toxin-antitoxin system VapC family toxin [Candidatus Protistobacter heckmanni]|nr:type II toxin-antitoxin system VapC family toxin [Candidatus Protistobacter heckmanni]
MRYLFDTNMASYAIKGTHPALLGRLRSLEVGQVAVSAITQAELLFGLAKKAYPARLSEAVEAFLMRVDILPWDEQVAPVYARLRATAQSGGAVLAAMDMLIAAHALAADAVLVSADKAFWRLPAELRVEDWSV